jgi:hypothetical protein
MFAALAALFIMSGCMAPAPTGVRDYDSLMAANQVKRIDYYCNFEKIAIGDFQQHGDYCQMADNQDYVSYFTSFDVQSTNLYRPYLIQTVNMIASENVPGQLRYYQIFSGDDFLKLTRYEVEHKQPTSFALKDKDSYHIVISKPDLLMRTKIYPEYSVLSLRYEGQEEPKNVGEYIVRYRIAPYTFDKPYGDIQSSRILGLPDRTAVAGRLNSVQRLQLNSYSTLIERYWSYNRQYQYSTDYITALDYALPQLLLAKQGFQSELSFPVPPPLPEEGLLNDYLPAYELQEVQIVYADGFGSERVLQSYNKDDIAKVIISYENEALTYSTLVNHDSFGIRFIYKPMLPRVKDIDPALADELGISYIYSTLGATIETQLNVLRFYELEKLPRACVDERAMIEGFIAKGRTEADARALLARMSSEQVKTCTADQISIGEQLVNLQ